MSRSETSDQAPSSPPQAVHRQEVSDILARHGGDRGGLIAVLEQIQSQCGYLPEEALRTVSRQTGRPLVEVYGLATFYRCFTLKPRGKHLVCACLGTACHVRGAARVVEELERHLGIPAGETTPDGEFTLETVNCLGACALGPVVVVDGHYFSKVTKARVRQLLDEASAGLLGSVAGEHKQAFPVDLSCPRCNHSLMDAGFPLDGRPSVRCSVSFDARHGWARWSSLYGSSAFAAEPGIPAGTVARFYCPYCHDQILGGSACPACEAPMVPTMIRGGGILQFCSRGGCQSRVLELV